MPIDIRRCAEAAARAALTEAFAPAPPPPPPRRRHRLRPLRAILLGAGMVTTARMALSAERRQELREALASRLPLHELIDEIRREVEAEWASDEPEDGPEAVDMDLEEDGEEFEAGDEESDEDGEEPEDLDEARAETAPPKATTDQGAPAPRRSPAGEGSRRRRASRARGVGDGQRPRMPPHRGSRA